MKKLSFLLCFALLLSTLSLCVAAGDYGADTQKLVITHIDVAATYEGAGVIYTSSTDGTLSPYGSFDWWNVVTFEWSEADGCYTVAEVNANAGTAKGNIKIPENGFAYCVNTGNNWPELYAKDPVTYAGYANAPDYTSAHASDSFAYAATLKKGDKVYLYGTDLKNIVILNNGANWYADEFESNSFIKIGSEESGKTAYNPNNATEIKPEYSFGINAINTTVKEGQSMLLTPSYGKTVTAKGNNYNWSRIAVFDWSEKDGAYVLISLDASVGNGMEKNAIIPPNGFAISVNKGNDYSASGGINYVNATSSNVYDNIAEIEIGTKVYLEGIDIANGSFEYDGDISAYYTSSFKTKGFIKVCEAKPENCYTPDVSNILDAPKFSNAEAIYTLGDVKIEWDAVEGAEKYFVSVYNSTVNPNGAVLTSSEVTETSITIPKDKLSVGAKTAVRIFAYNSKGASPIASHTFTICSERALDSAFRDKTVVAFGDSITAWTGWVSMLYGELGCEVINAGVGGDRTVQALARIDHDVIANNPDLVIVNFGMNDQAVNTSTGKNLTPIEQYETNYRTIIDKIKATGSDIILVAVHDVCTEKYGGGSPKYDSKDADGVTYVDRYNEVVKKLADEYKLGFLDINTLAEDNLSELIMDGIHLSDAGQKQYCKWISDYCFEYAEIIWNDSDNSDVVSDSSESESDASDNSGEASTGQGENEGGLSALETTLIICAMFIVIAVVGVMFIKVVIKNKNNK